MRKRFGKDKRDKVGVDDVVVALLLLLLFSFFS